MKSTKSAAEIQIKEAINHMKKMINKQNVRIPDAEYLTEIACKILYKCEDLRLSRDNWRNRAETAETKLK